MFAITLNLGNARFQRVPPSLPAPPARLARTLALLCRDYHNSDDRGAALLLAVMALNAVRDCRGCGTRSHVFGAALLVFDAVGWGYFARGVCGNGVRGAGQMGGLSLSEVVYHLNFSFEICPCVSLNLWFENLPISFHRLLCRSNAFYHFFPTRNHIPTNLVLDFCRL